MGDKRIQYPRDDWADRELGRKACAQLLKILYVFVIGAAIGVAWLVARA